MPSPTISHVAWHVVRREGNETKGASAKMNPQNLKRRSEADGLTIQTGGQGQAAKKSDGRSGAEEKRETRGRERERIDDSMILSAAAAVATVANSKQAKLSSLHIPNSREKPDQKL